MRMNRSLEVEKAGVGGQSDLMEAMASSLFKWAALYEEALSIGREGVIGYTATGHTKKLIVDTEVEFTWRGTVQVIALSHKTPACMPLADGYPRSSFETSNFTLEAALQII
jgi:hypothetical protein